MTNLTIKELADLNRLVKKQKARFLADSSNLHYAHKPDAECPAFVQKNRKRVAELTALSEKLEQMILETE